MNDMNMNDSAIEKLRKDLMINRMITIAASVLMLCILVGGFLVFTQLKDYAEMSMPLMEQVSEKLSALDIDALNEAIAGLNTEELSKALENLNEAVEGLEKIGESWKSFTSKFGF